MTGSCSPSRNLVPGRYRGVAMATVDGPLDIADLRAQLLGRPAYRRTRFLVLRGPDGTAVARVRKESEEPLFSPIVAVELLAGPDECTYVQAPEVDTAVPSALAHAARRYAPSSRAVVVQGRYEHVSFILDPDPLRVVVSEVVPPFPPKLFDQARRVLDTAEELPPIELTHELIDLRELARDHPAGDYLLPCRGSGVDVPGARTHYLDQRPAHTDWLLLGCARSREIYRWFYGHTPAGIDFCPRTRAAQANDRAGGHALLTKCCLQEESLESGPGMVCVPWGSSLEHVRRALVELARQLEPTWAPG